MGAWPSGQEVTMQITIVAAGTRGDVQPLVAPTTEFEALVKEQGLAYYELSGSPSQMMQGADMMAAMGGNRNPVTLVWRTLQSIKPQFAQGVRDVWQASQGADLIILSMLGFYGGYHAAEKLSIPFIEAYVLPGRPTRAFPSPLLGVDLRLGGLANWLSHKAVLSLAWSLFQPIVNHARAVALDLPPISLPALFRGFERSRQPILYGFSSLFLPRPPDWPEWHHVTGYWFLDHPTGWEPPADLAGFLASGTPPAAGRAPDRLGWDQRLGPARRGVEDRLSPARLAVPTHGRAGASRGVGHDGSRAESRSPLDSGAVRRRSISMGAAGQQAGSWPCAHPAHNAEC